MQNQLMSSHKPLKQKRKQLQTFPFLIFYIILFMNSNWVNKWLGWKRSNPLDIVHRADTGVKKLFLVLLFYPYDTHIWAQAFLWFLTSAQTLWRVQFQLKYQGD